MKKTEIDRTALIYMMKIGLTNSKIHQKLGVSHATFYRYIRKNPISKEELDQVKLELNIPTSTQSELE